MDPILQSIEKQEKSILEDNVRIIDLSKFSKRFLSKSIIKLLVQ